MGKLFFLFFLNIDPNSSKKFSIEIQTSSFQICFRNQFQLWEMVKRKVCKYTYLHIFSFTTSRCQKFIEKVHISVYKKIKSFGHYFKKSKKLFSIVFSKSYLTGMGKRICLWRLLVCVDY